MRIRKQDANGDMVFGQGQRSLFINQKEGVGQLVETRLRLLYGEWFGDPTDGVPYAQDVLGKSSPDVYNGVIKNRILSTTGVLEINSFTSTMNRATRALTITVDISTIYGNVSVTTIL